MRDIDLTPQSPLARFQARIKASQDTPRGRTLALRDTAQDHFGKALSNFNQAFSDTREQNQVMSSRRAMEAMLRRGQETIDSRTNPLAGGAQVNPLGSRAVPVGGASIGGMGGVPANGQGYVFQNGHVEASDPDEEYLLTRESYGGDPTADNENSTAFGVGQLLESNRRAYGQRFGFDPNTTNPHEQMTMFRAYVQDRYGSMAAARRFWDQHNWY